MRFSDAFLRQLRDRVSIADYAGRRLVWDKRKSRPAAGDFWACCPFHQEKSPSFHVLDAKGIYKCFGCGEKGDVFGLAMALEGLSFPEAIARLAEYSGMELPQDEMEDRGQSDRRRRLMSIVARASVLYAEALRTPQGQAARKYLEGRGLAADTWPRLGIGFAPGGWTWLIDKLKAENYQIGEIIDAGLAREGEEGKRAIDTFRDRIMFEITDPAGKPIAFGGRALDPENKAKYINSPECEVFSKGRTLYRLKHARETLAKTKAGGLVVAEGYLDVIAFERAGIGAVAPMGTALTEEQLQLVWRSGGEPVLCFDGDAAGRRAAERTLELALPHLGPDRTVKIALLQEGEDPDDLYRRAGAQALASLLAAAQPASDALFERERARRPLTTPEARAAFKQGLREAVLKIADADTRRLYMGDLLGRADAITRPPPREPYRKGEFRRNEPAPATAELKAISGGHARPAAENFLRAAIDYPGVLARFSDWIDRLAIHDRELEAVRTALLALSAHENGVETIDREGLTRHLHGLGEERAAARVSRWPKPRAANADFEAEWLAHVTLQVVLPAIREEMAELQSLEASGDPDAMTRFQALNREAKAIEKRAREWPEGSKQDDANDLVA